MQRQILHVHTQTGVFTNLQAGAIGIQQVEDAFIVDLKEGNGTCELQTVTALKYMRSKNVKDSQSIFERVAAHVASE